MANKLFIAMIVIMDLIISFPSKSQDGSWIDKLQNQQYGVCCYDNDGRRLDDPDWDTLGKVDDDHNDNSGYRVRDDNKWIDVPNWAIVIGQNLDGIPRVWFDRHYNDDGSVTKTIRCFLKGTFG